MPTKPMTIVKPEQTPAPDQPEKPASPKTTRTPVGKPAPATPVGKPAPATKPKLIDTTTPEYYLNRELTWLNFNRRVLHEAEDDRTKLLERVKFIAIVCANMDEFFMKRIGGLKQQVGAGITKLTLDGRSPMEQIKASHEIIRQIDEWKKKIFHNLLTKLASEDIHLLGWNDISEEERDYLRDEYYRNIFPLVTPQGIDPAHPFPFISNLSMNLLVMLRHPDHGEISLARVKVPLGSDVPRFLKIPDSYRFVRLEEIMSRNLDLLFPKMEVLSVETFRVTRNAIAEMDEDTVDDLLAMIETELRFRKFAPIVRLQVCHDMDPVHRGMLAAELGLDEQADVFEEDSIMGKSSLMEISTLDIPHLHDTPFVPIDHPRLKDKSPIFYKLRDDGPILLFHPYESFSTSVERFLMEASEDPKVRGIKMTLYRTSKDSKAIQYLVNAALNGKQVTVVVELKARFDEAANIQWANYMEEAGIHVTYGVVGLKTHSKVILVVRKDYEGVRRYAHFSTGNYHAVTARLYTDLGLFTCDDTIGQDLTEYFNYLSTGYTPKRNYKKLLVAPSDMKKALIAKIHREIEKSTPESPGLIRLKTNAMQDHDIIQALYKAGMAGVKVELIVRDTCCLRPGIPGVSESIRVISIVGRFLEHARIYYFENNGEEEYFIGSADCMIRNLESRVEVLVPVEDTRLQLEFKKILDIQLSDNRSAWEMKSDGSYEQLKPARSTDKGSQDKLIELAYKRQKAASMFKRLKSRGKSKKEYWHAY